MPGRVEYFVCGARGSGIIALVLQVNPNLTWGDVQGFLVQTSRHLSEDPKDQTKETNDAGFTRFTHSNLVGFGVPDARAAVEAAKTRELWPAEKMVIHWHHLFLPSLIRRLIITP
jgi:hypothetical protein